MKFEGKILKVSEVERMYEGYLEEEAGARAGGGARDPVESFQEFVVAYMREEGAGALEVDAPMGSLWGTCSGEEALDSHVLAKESASGLSGAQSNIQGAS